MSSTTARAATTGAPLAAALDAAADAALEGAGDAGAVEANAAPLDVRAVDVLAVRGDEGAADDATGVDVDVLACLEPELHAVAKVASATRAATRRYRRDDVGTGLLK
ncbi:MAG TPA: hypothetical protein VII50_09200 [Acidothermaceae bacterium]